MSTGAERARWLIDAAQARGGDVPSQRDLELWAHLDIRLPAVAEQILWERRSVLLDAFPELVPALDGPAVGAPAASPPPPGPEVGRSPEARFRRLLEWRAQHPDEAVAAIADQDLARLASSGATGRSQVEAAAGRLASNAVVTRHAEGIARALGGEAAPSPAEEPTPEPEQAPTPQAAAVPEPTLEPEAGPLEWERVPPFATFSWADGPARPYGHLSADLEDDLVRLAWTPAQTDAPVTLYRVVESSSNWPQGAPELGGVVGVTRGTAGTVRLHQSGAVTYLAVWVNQGQTLLEAAHAQPRLVGVSQIVWPPSKLTVQVTANQTVTALFTAPPGSRVEVQRFPKGATIAYDITRELDRTHVTSTGFRDLAPLMGEEIVYAAFCVAELADGSSRVSRPATGVVQVTPDVEQVRVQVVRSTTTPGAYDISWLRPPHGEVRLYATPERPEQGIENEPRTLEIVEGQGRLTSEFRINYPPVDHGGLMTITGFAVDPSWVRAHFVAVHWVSDDAVWVGPIVSMVTPHPPTHGQVIERVDSQIITFAWPEGVGVVQAYQGPRGQSLDPAGSEPVAQLTRDQYVKMGGMRITRTLPSNGCAIHLYGVVYLDGRPVYSDPQSVDYPGITRLSYQVIGYGADGAPSAPGVWPVTYRVFAEVDDDLHDTPLVIVARPDRLPLHPQDGRDFGQPIVSLTAGQPTPIAEIPVGPTRALLRVFVNLPPAECGAIAVLDPAVYTLEVGL